GANLADNPFVVIGQGLVDQILALRPSDRRTVIEEAAGTRRLQLRREEALNRLKSAEVELVRVNDILREIGPRVEALRDQAAKWSEYETIRNELRRRALRWYKASFGTTADQRADLTTKIVGVDKEATNAARSARESADSARTAEEDASRTRVALAEARAARVETERAHLIRESDEIRLGDEERSLLARDEELAATAARLTKER